MALIHNIVGPPTAERVLLLVHGYGADERDLGGVLPYLDPEGRFLAVLPRGPVAAPPGFGWFDLDSVQPGHVTDATFLAALDELDDLLDTVDTDAVNLAMGYRYPAGAVRRLDDALLAKFGERYVALHGNSDRVSMLESRLAKL